METRKNVKKHYALKVLMFNVVQKKSLVNTKFFLEMSFPQLTISVVEARFELWTLIYVFICHIEPEAIILL
jgi:hypothetical protein